MLSGENVEHGQHIRTPISSSLYPVLITSMRKATFVFGRKFHAGRLRCRHGFAVFVFVNLLTLLTAAIDSQGETLKINGIITYSAYTNLNDIAFKSETG